MNSDLNVSENASENLTKLIKKEWAMPELLIFSKESINGGIAAGNEGTGPSTAS
ncbi:MAG: hypothetical protein NTZ19_01405 [Bacteroidetes bacterium]|nr:hypothetical protein [Bacteroidota bacterium]